MFLTEAILRPKEPLARVWLAAHMERKLTKAMLVDTDLTNPINAIIGVDQPPMALRLSGQLLLGVVRIYSRKTKYLLEDCNDALVKIKMAFRPGLVDLPHDQVVSNLNAITMPDVLNQFDILLPEPEFNLKRWDFTQGLDKNLSHAYDITLLDSRGMESPMLLNPTDDYLVGGDDNIDLGLGLELDPELFTPHSMSGMTPGGDMMDIEVGRDASSVMHTPGFDGADMSGFDASKVLEMPSDFDHFPQTPFGDNNLESQMAGLNIQEAPGDVPITQPTQRKDLKRKILVDDITQLTQEQIRAQINDPSSIVEASDFIPIFKKPHQLLNFEKSAVSYYLDFSAPLNLVPHQKEQFQAATSAFNMSNIAQNMDTLLAPTPGFGNISSPMQFQHDDGFRAYDFQTPGFMSKLFGMTVDDGEAEAFDTIPETPAQANQIRLGRSTLKARDLLRSQMTATRGTEQEVEFSSIAGPEKVAKRDAVKFFFETLVLRNKNLISVEQDSAYGEIKIKPTESFFDDENILPTGTPFIPSTV